MKTDSGKTMVSVLEICKYANMNKEEANAFMSVFRYKIPTFSRMTKTIRSNKYGKHDAIVDMTFFILDDAIEYCKEKSERENINKTRKKNLSILLKIKKSIES